MLDAVNPQDSRRSAAQGGTEPSEITVGLSIPIPPPYVDALRSCRRRSGDRMADLVNPHITLIPPTPVPTDELEGLIEDLRERCARHQRFRVRLRGTGSFRPVSDVVFVAVAEGISSCELLADSLRVGPLRTPLRFPYHPHVTVAQDVSADALDAAFEGLEGFRADLMIDEVWVHRQEADESWTPLGTLPLAEGKR